jgi:hypothetical protein
MADIAAVIFEIVNDLGSLEQKAVLDLTVMVPNSDPMVALMVFVDEVPDQPDGSVHV